MTICNQELIEKVKNELVRRKALRPCPRCGQANFSIENQGLIVHILQKEDRSLIIGGGTVIPTAVVVCTNCGYIMEHAIGVLGLLDDKSNKQIDSSVKPPLDDKEVKK